MQTRVTLNYHQTARRKSVLKDSNDGPISRETDFEFHSNCINARITRASKTFERGASWKISTTTSKQQNNFYTINFLKIHRCNFTVLPTFSIGKTYGNPESEQKSPIEKTSTVFDTSHSLRIQMCERDI